MYLLVSYFLGVSSREVAKMPKPWPFTWDLKLVLCILLYVQMNTIEEKSKEGQAICESIHHKYFNVVLTSWFRFVFFLVWFLFFFAKTKYQNEIRVEYIGRKEILKWIFTTKIFIKIYICWNLSSTHIRTYDKTEYMISFMPMTYTYDLFASVRLYAAYNK